ncbi:M48 family metallopeptidase [Streptacidiphilus rugosus]|uniref:M48 family metallopeptidase n=1 Tax=Streptacidiphilus rugosus TaxID=405783 RepID=UPI00068B277C|nr:M48 family metallopeptidase [Streptacidiphilus rugosus]
MRAFLRTAQALALLLGFYALILGLLAAIVALDIGTTAAAGARGGMILVEVWAVSLALAYPLLRGLFIGGGNRRRPAGVRVHRTEQPRLWQRVDHVAAAINTVAPAEIWLVDDVQAAVSQSSWLLGLIPGRRRMLLGLPLLTGLTTAELDAVIAHELGHYGHGDTRLGGIVARNRAGLQQVLARYSAEEGGWGQWIGSLFRRYARFCLLRSQASARRQELAADAAAARVAGREATISALRALAPLDEAHQRFGRDYAGMGWALGLRPTAEEVVPGFQAFLRSEAWRQEHARLLADPPRRKQSPYDSHPPTAERIAALQALAGVPGPRGADADPDARADALLDDPVVTAGLVVSARPGAASRTQLGWTELAAAAGNAELDQESAALRTAAKAVLRREVDVPLLLDVIDAGRWSDVVDWMPREGMSRTVTPAAGLSMNGAAASDCLYSMLLAAFVGQRRGRWTLDWESGRRLVLDEGLDAAIGPALDAACAPEGSAPPTTAPLRELLRLTAARSS